MATAVLAAARSNLMVQALNGGAQVPWDRLLVERLKTAGRQRYVVLHDPSVTEAIGLAAATHGHGDGAVAQGGLREHRTRALATSRLRRVVPPDGTSRTPYAGSRSLARRERLVRAGCMPTADPGVELLVNVATVSGRRRPARLSTDVAEIHGREGLCLVQSIVRVAGEPGRPVAVSSKLSGGSRRPSFDLRVRRVDRPGIWRLLNVAVVIAAGAHLTANQAVWTHEPRHRSCLISPRRRTFLPATPRDRRRHPAGPLTLKREEPKEPGRKRYTLGRDVRR
jgi:hypothetical protein